MSGRTLWTVVEGATLVTEAGLIPNGVLAFHGKEIVYAGGRSGFEAAGYADASALVERIDAGGQYLVPGFVDIHVHGGGGGDFMDADAGAYERITRFHAGCGTTTMLATTVTAGKQEINGVLEAVRIYRSRTRPGADLAGVHLEGPFISPKWPGAQNPSAIVPPRVDWLEDWTAAYPGLIRIVTLAPETEGALEAVAWLDGRGITASAGHTDADYATILAAADQGLRHAVHTFNAMKGLHHREPGTVGAVMADPRIRAEVIADGFHVHPAVIALLARAKGPDGLVLITDAISAAGMGNGSYQLGGLDVTVRDGVARLTDGGALAGSTLTMIEAFRFAVNRAGLSLEDASRAASVNPAKAAGLYDVTGSLAAGKQADFLLLSPGLELKRIWIQGREFRPE